MIKSKNPNQIQQAGFGCTHCGKHYKTRTNLNKHLILCEIVSKAKKSEIKKTSIKNEDITEIEPIPSQNQMYKIILDLAIKCNHLEEKVEQMQKWVNKKKKKINGIEWLIKQYPKPSQTFEEMKDSIVILKEETEHMLQHPFLEVLKEIIDRIFQVHHDMHILPFFAFTDKPNTLYIYHGKTQAQEWRESTKEEILGFLKAIHFKMASSFIEWKKENREKIMSSDGLSDLYNKANIKIMGVNMKDDTTFQRAKSLIYQKIKTEMKTVFLEC